MGLFIIFHVFLVFSQLHYTTTERRIVGGHVAKGEVRNHMAYLIKAPVPDVPTYDAWICGGAIVTYRAIVTSAACIQDVKYMYAVTGYNRYVQTDQMRDDECTSNSRKKVVFSCVPITHKFAYHGVGNWTNADIGLVFVDSDFDFKTLIRGCSWRPEILPINEVQKCQEEGTSAVVLGFGHQEKWRQVTDTKDYNEKLLRYASVRVMNKDECMRSYLGYPVLHDIIDKLMICTNSTGLLNSNGDPIKKPDQEVMTCRGAKCLRYSSDKKNHDKVRPFHEIRDEAVRSHRTRQKSKKYIHEHTNEDSDFDHEHGHGADHGHGSDYDSDSFRRDLSNTTTVALNINHRRQSDDLEPESQENLNPGICQNDHGGPLISWCGTKPYLIGVASVFLVSPREQKCKGPYLYTSAYCNRDFLKCVMVKIGHALSKKKIRSDSSDSEDIRRDEILKGYEEWYQTNKKFCESPPTERGFDIKSRRISWASHPDGPAENELDEELFERPQMPLDVLRNLKEPFGT